MHHLKPWGSYEQWSNVVREAVTFAGFPDPGVLQRRDIGNTYARAPGYLMDILHFETAEGENGIRRCFAPPHG